MNMYSASVRCGAIANVAHRGIAQLWNPSSAVSLWVCEIIAFKTTTLNANEVHEICRGSTRGTPAGTTTPTIENNWDRSIAPPSGALLDFGAYTSNPTVISPYLAYVMITNLIGISYDLIFDPPIRVMPGTGLLIATGAAIAAAISDINFIWEE